MARALCECFHHRARDLPSVAAIRTAVWAIVAAAAIIVVAMVVMVVGDRIAHESCGGDASDGYGGIDGLDGSACGVVSGHAAHACSSGKCEGNEGGDARNHEWCFHARKDVGSWRLFNRLFSAVAVVAATGFTARAGEAYEKDRERDCHDSRRNESLPFHD